MLDYFAHDHDIGRRRGQRQTCSLDSGLDQGESTSASLPQSICGPVNPDELMTWVEACGYRRSQTVPAPDVNDQGWARRGRQHAIEHPRLPARPVWPRRQRYVRILIKLTQAVRDAGLDADISVNSHGSEFDVVAG